MLPTKGERTVTLTSRLYREFNPRADSFLDAILRVTKYGSGEFFIEYSPQIVKKETFKYFKN